MITGNGDVLEPEQGIAAIGSGGAFAQAAARALFENRPATGSNRQKALTIAGDLISTLIRITSSNRWHGMPANKVDQHDANDPAGNCFRTG